MYVTNQIFQEDKRQQQETKKINNHRMLQMAQLAIRLSTLGC